MSGNDCAVSGTPVSSSACVVRSDSSKHVVVMRYMKRWPGFGYGADFQKQCKRERFKKSHAKTRGQFGGNPTQAHTYQCGECKGVTKLEEGKKRG